LSQEDPLGELIKRRTQTGRGHCSSLSEKMPNHS
jgi:hypothetical protein